MSISKNPTRTTASARFAATRLLGLAAGLSLAAFIGACASTGQVNYPGIPGDSNSNSVNNPPAPQVMESALYYVVRRFPPIAAAPGNQAAPNQAFAINLPPGMDPENLQHIIAGVGNGARALTDETKSLPLYHVSRVWVRGTSATVDIIRPVFSLPDRPVAPLYQGVTLHLRSRGWWHVETVQQFPVGSPDVPALNIISTKPFEPPAAPAPAVEPEVAPASETPASPAGTPATTPAAEPAATAPMMPVPSTQPSPNDPK